VYNWTGAGGTEGNFNAEVPGNWGGEYGDGAVTAFRTGPDPAGYCNFSILFTGYMLFDYLITNGSGKASLSFRVDSSYHVLYKTTQRTRTSNDGPIKTATFDPS
jgi:hypothetical protein